MAPATGDAQRESLSDYSAQPVAFALVEPCPHLGARIYRALAVRILDAKKSRYYADALTHIEAARDCYFRADRAPEWDRLVAALRSQHARKSSFMPGFAGLLVGGTIANPSWIERAKRKWPHR